MGGRRGRKRSPNGIGEQIFAEVEKLTADGKDEANVGIQGNRKQDGRTARDGLRKLLPDCS